jgi:hypothetical protein
MQGRGTQLYLCQEAERMPRAGGDLRVLVLEGFREGLPLYGGAPVFLQDPEPQLRPHELLQGDALALLLLRRGQAGKVPRALIAL